MLKIKIKKKNYGEMPSNSLPRREPYFNVASEFTQVLQF